MKFVLGKKVGMSQVWDNGKVTPVTIVEVEPNKVLQVKTKETDGYEAVQIGTGSKRHVAKPQKGHFKDLGNFRDVVEFRTLQQNDQDVKVGDAFDATLFATGDMVKVSALSRGKGFAGAMKRHGFSGMPMGHGHKHVARHIGSIGQRFPQHTLKGKKMAGRTGHVRKTVRGLKVVQIDQETNMLAVKGSVPGIKGALLEIVSIN